MARKWILRIVIALIAGIILSSCRNLSYDHSRNDGSSIEAEASTDSALSTEMRLLASTFTLSNGKFELAQCIEGQAGNKSVCKGGVYSDGSEPLSNIYIALQGTKELAVLWVNPPGRYYNPRFKSASFSKPSKDNFSFYYLITLDPVRTFIPLRTQISTPRSQILIDSQRSLRLKLETKQLSEDVYLQVQPLSHMGIIQDSKALDEFKKSVLSTGARVVAGIGIVATNSKHDVIPLETLGFEGSIEFGLTRLFRGFEFAEVSTIFKKDETEHLRLSVYHYDQSTEKWKSLTPESDAEASYFYTSNVEDAVIKILTGEAFCKDEAFKELNGNEGVCSLVPISIAQQQEDLAHLPSELFIVIENASGFAHKNSKFSVQDVDSESVIKSDVMVLLDGIPYRPDDQGAFEAVFATAEVKAFFEIIAPGYRTRVSGLASSIFKENSVKPISLQKIIHRAGMIRGRVTENSDTGKLVEGAKVTLRVPGMLSLDQLEMTGALLPPNPVQFDSPWNLNLIRDKKNNLIKAGFHQSAQYEWSVKNIIVDNKSLFNKAELFSSLGSNTGFNEGHYLKNAMIQGLQTALIQVTVKHPRITFEAKERETWNEVLEGFVNIKHNSFVWNASNPQTYATQTLTEMSRFCQSNPFDAMTKPSLCTEDGTCNSDFFQQEATYVFACTDERYGNTNNFAFDEIDPRMFPYLQIKVEKEGYELKDKREWHPLMNYYSKDSTLLDLKPLVLVKKTPQNRNDENFVNQKTASEIAPFIAALYFFNDEEGLGRIKGVVYEHYYYDQISQNVAFDKSMGDLQLFWNELTIPISISDFIEADGSIDLPIPLKSGSNRFRLKLVSNARGSYVTSWISKEYYHEPAATVKGTIQLENSTPSDYRDINISFDVGGSRSSTVSDSKGNFRFENVPASHSVVFSVTASLRYEAQHQVEFLSNGKLENLPQLILSLQETVDPNLQPAIEVSSFVLENPSLYGETSGCSSSLSQNGEGSVSLVKLVNAWIKGTLSQFDGNTLLVEVNNIVGKNGIEQYAFKAASGAFNCPVFIPPGANIVSVKAINKNQKEAVWVGVPQAGSSISLQEKENVFVPITPLARKESIQFPLRFNTALSKDGLKDLALYVKVDDITMDLKDDLKRTLDFLDKGTLSNDNEGLEVLLAIENFGIESKQGYHLIQFIASFPSQENIKGEMAVSQRYWVRTALGTPPTGLAKNLTFTDGDPNGGKLSGNMVLTPGTDNKIEYYLLYWGKPRDEGNGMEIIKNIPAIQRFEKDGKPDFKLTDATIPEGATHFLVYSANLEGGEGLKPFSLPIKDASKPVVIKDADTLEIVFKDINSDKGVITGELALSKMEKDTQVTMYNFYWGDSEERKIKEIKSVSKENPVVSLNNESIESAVYFLIYKANDAGESEGYLAKRIIDNYPPSEKAAGISFEDENPKQGILTGTLSLTKANDESIITYYKVYWGEQDGLKLKAMNEEPLLFREFKKDQELVAKLEDIPIPEHADYWLVYTGNEGGEMSDGLSFKLADVKVSNNLCGSVITTLGGACCDRSNLQKTCPELQTNRCETECASLQTSACDAACVERIEKCETECERFFMLDGFILQAENDGYLAYKGYTFDEKTNPQGILNLCMLARYGENEGIAEISVGGTLLHKNVEVTAENGIPHWAGSNYCSNSYRVPDFTKLTPAEPINWNFDTGLACKDGDLDSGTIQLTCNFSSPKE
ncbi:carboxypeptidase-like regulatory domain-containing protein [Deltaproteobacteria bacterium TL4]